MHMANTATNFASYYLRRCQVVDCRPVARPMNTVRAAASSVAVWVRMVHMFIYVYNAELYILLTYLTYLLTS